MTLKLSDMLKKADEKGFTPTNNKQITKPWQNESILYETDNSIENKILDISPSNIVNWEFHDRPESELGDITNLAENILSIGQQQPCVVRPIKNSNKYELIIGERRWHATTLAKINLKVIVKDLNDSEAALAQATENDSRKDLSDYAKGISFSRLIKSNIISQKDLIHKLGKSKQYISRLLSFNKIPNEIVSAIGDMSKISSNTAEKIYQLSKKGDDFKQAIIKLANLISEGKLGANKLNERVRKEVNTSNVEQKENKKLFFKNGKHAFTFVKEKNTAAFIYFPKYIRCLFEQNTINSDLFTNKILQILERELDEN